MSPEIEILLSKPWQKFFAKFEEINSIKVSQWKEVHLLAYISKRFEDTFGRKFPVTIKGAPSKSTDVYQAKQIMAMLGTTNMKTVKDYIDWVYDNKVVPKNAKFRKIGYFLTSDFMNEFMFAKEAKMKIKRSTELPADYKCIADNLGVHANTYGDLAFIKMAADQGSNQYKLLFANLEVAGFDSTVLERISE
jgi:hypothetical protein